MQNSGGKKVRDFVITVNSTVDMPKEWLEERDIKVVPLRYTIDGTTYVDMEGLSSKEFFDKLREGKMSVTSQVNPDEAKEALEKYRGTVVLVSHEPEFYQDVVDEIWNAESWSTKLI